MTQLKKLETYLKGGGYRALLRYAVSYARDRTRGEEALHEALKSVAEYLSGPREEIRNWFGFVAKAIRWKATGSARDASREVPIVEHRATDIVLDATAGIVCSAELDELTQTPSAEEEAIKRETVPWLSRHLEERAETAANRRLRRGYELLRCDLNADPDEATAAPSRGGTDERYLRLAKADLKKNWPDGDILPPKKKD